MKEATVDSRAVLDRLIKHMRLDPDFGGFSLWKNFPGLGLRTGFRLVGNEQSSALQRVKWLYNV
eukprot:5250269-Pyramimonas_sp.AAC.1